MGAAASTAPSKLGVEGVKKICGDKFEQEVFDSMKDKDGFVTKEQLIALEKEIEAQAAAAETASPTLIRRSESDWRKDSSSPKSSSSNMPVILPARSGCSFGS